jgi:hypothetical protein
VAHHKVAKDFIKGLLFFNKLLLRRSVQQRLFKTTSALHRLHILA